MATISENETLSPLAKRQQRLRAALGVRRVSGWCEVEGTRVAWEEFCSTTDVQTVVFLHSAGSGSREFRPVLDRRPPGSRLLFLDWPWHGRSESSIGLDCAKNGRDGFVHTNGFTVDFAVRVVNSVLEQLGISEAVLVGAGFGAAAAIQMAGYFPAKVLGLVLCQPAGLVERQGSSAFSSTGKLKLGVLLRRMARLTPAHPDEVVRAAARRQALRLASVRVAMMGLRFSAERSLKEAEAGLRQAIGRLRCPALFAFSQDALEYPVRKYVALLDPSLAWAPQHQFTIFTGSFSPIWDEPDRFAIALTSFLQAQLPVELHSHAWQLAAADYPAKGSNLWKCVHPECYQERILHAGLDANQDANLDANQDANRWPKRQ